MIMAIIVLATSAHSVMLRAQGSYTLAPSKTEYRLFKNMEIRESVTYMGIGYPRISNWDYCELEIYLMSPISGISGTITSKSCEKNGIAVSVSISVSISGKYTGGGTVNWIPFSSVAAKIYANGTVADVVYFSVLPIIFKEVVIKGIDFDTPAVDKSSVSYETTASEVPVGTAVTIYPVAATNLVITLSDYLSFPATVNLRYQVGNKSWDGYITFDTNSLAQKFKTAPIPFNMPLLVEVIYNNASLYSTALDLPSKASSENLGSAMISTAPPIVYKKDNAFFVRSQLNILQLSGGHVEIIMNVVADGRRESASGTYSSPTYVNNLEIPLGDKRPSSISGEYIIKYVGSNNREVNVRATFTAISYELPSSSLVRYVFYLIFMFVTSSSFGSIIAGLFLRRPELQSAGVLMLATGVLIFLIPIIMGNVVYLLVRTSHAVDPIGIGTDIKFSDFGRLVESAIQKTCETAIARADEMSSYATGALGALVALAAAGAALGAVGIFTGGALSTIVGQIVGAIGSILVQLATVGYLSAIFLKALALIYPIFINVILTVLLFMALLQALFSMFTGMYGQVFHTVISISIVILSVLLTPIVLATIEQLKAEHTYVIPYVNIPIPNIFVTLPLTLIEVMFLTSMMVLAFQRLLAVFSGMT